VEVSDHRAFYSCSFLFGGRNRRDDTPTTATGKKGRMCSETSQRNASIGPVVLPCLARIDANVDAPSTDPPAALQQALLAAP
jgi:hypothetical protein